MMAVYIRNDCPEIDLFHQQILKQYRAGLFKYPYHEMNSLFGGNLIWKPFP